MKISIKQSEEKTIIIYDLESLDIEIPANTKLNIIAIIEKGWEDTRKLNFKLKGENAEINFHAFIIGKNTEKFKFETHSIHISEKTKAKFQTYCTLFDQSETNYKGNIIVKAKAQMTDAYLAHHSLLLSNKAKTITIPCLEIEADNVKAGHAATVGKIDPELLYYLESRGINKEEGEKILIKSFMEKGIQKINDTKTREQISKEIEDRLNKIQ